MMDVFFSFTETESNFEFLDVFCRSRSISVNQIVQSQLQANIVGHIQLRQDVRITEMKRHSQSNAGDMPNSLKGLIQ